MESCFEARRVSFPLPSQAVAHPPRSASSPTHRPCRVARRGTTSLPRRGVSFPLTPPPPTPPFMGPGHATMLSWPALRDIHKCTIPNFLPCRHHLLLNGYLGNSIAWGVADRVLSSHMVSISISPVLSLRTVQALDLFWLALLVFALRLRKCVALGAQFTSGSNFIIRDYCHFNLLTDIKQIVG